MRGGPAFLHSSVRLSRLFDGYRIYSDAEDKSPKTIVDGSIKLLEQFLANAGLSTAVDGIGSNELRAFTRDLKRRLCSSNHPYARPQERSLSPHSVNTDVRSIRAFWLWLEEEGIITENRSFLLTPECYGFMIGDEAMRVTIPHCELKLGTLVHCTFTGTEKERL